MESSAFASDTVVRRLTIRWKRLGWAGCGFFLVKGLLWLLAPVVVYMMG